MSDVLDALQTGDIEGALGHFPHLSVQEKRQFLERVALQKSDAAARLLTALLPSLEEKDLRKLAKKLLFHLRTQGISIEEPQEAPAPSALKKVKTEREQLALTSNYDREGVRVILVAFEIRRKQFVFTHATDKFSRGLIDMVSAPMEKQNLDSMIRDYRSRTHTPMALVDISPSYAIYLLTEVSGKSGKMADEVKGLKRLAANLSGDVQKPSDIRSLPVSREGFGVSWQQALADTLFEPFFISWEGIEEDRKQYNSIVHPQIVLPPHIMEEKTSLYVKGLAASERLSSLRPVLLRTLEDYAYLFYKQGRHSYFSALLNCVESDQLYDGAVQFFIRKSLEQKQEEPEHTPGIIVSPYS